VRGDLVISKGVDLRLDQFEWSRNPRGMHVKSVLITPLDISRWTSARIGWVKLVAADFEYVDDSMDFLAAGITPVLRLYRARWGAAPFDRKMRDETLLYMSAGVKWYEFYNEPNLPIEWQPGVNIDWRNMEIMAPLMDNWLVWAEFIVSHGCYPGFIPLAESDAPTAAAVRWMDTWLNYMAERHYDRFRYVLANGAYCATHPYILNHYYQEIPGRGPASAREPADQNAAEPGWHFEYPYDPICQRTDPGRTVYGGTALTPNGDPVGLTAMGRMFNERCAALFGTQAVPVLGTEGGIYPFPRDASVTSYQQDNRYPHYTHESQAEGTLAMFEWITHSAPPWLFGVCLWKEDDYFEPGPARAITRMREVAPLLRTVPPMEVMGTGYEPEPLVIPGPGPIHGQADFHIIILAPGLNTDWFFETAAAYWNQFRPIVTVDLSLIDYITSDKSLAVTVIAPPDSRVAMTQRIQQQYPNVWFDLILAEDAQSIAEVFTRRAQRNQRFG
jgi:hypothetical protein